MVQALRRTILKADPRISEGIKWRSVSFYCEGWFATLQERSKHGLLLVLHLGAKKRAAGGSGRGAIATILDGIFGPP